MAPKCAFEPPLARKGGSRHGPHYMDVEATLICEFNSSVPTKALVKLKDQGK